jgi:hypothetical protein
MKNWDKVHLFASKESDNGWCEGENNHRGGYSWVAERSDAGERLGVHQNDCFKV